MVLEGEVKEVKDEFKKHVFDVYFSGEMMGFTNALWTGFELVDHEDVGDAKGRARIKLLEGSRVNDMLQAVLPHAQIHGVQEVIPSMNDIFIEVVTEKEVAHG